MESGFGEEIYRGLEVEVRVLRRWKALDKTIEMQYNASVGLVVRPGSTRGRGELPSFCPRL